MDGYGRRRPRVRLLRAFRYLLMIIGVLTVVLLAINFTMWRGLYRLNRVAGVVGSSSLSVQFNREELRRRGLSPGSARSGLERALRDLGLPATVRSTQ